MCLLTYRSKHQKSSRQLSVLRKAVCFYDTYCNFTDAAYALAGASPESPNALMARSFSARFSSMASFSSISFTYLSRVVVARSFSSSFMVI